MRKLVDYLTLTGMLILIALIFWGLLLNARELETDALGLAGDHKLQSTEPDPLTDHNLQSSNSITLYTYLPVVYMNAGYVNPFGIVMYGGVSDSQGRQHMTQAGATIVTTTLYWSVVEPIAPIGSSHSYDWSVYDANFGAAMQAGMDIFVLFTGNPSWAAQYVGGPLYSGRINDLKAFLSVAVERYDGDGIDDAPGSPVATYWSFYAEPDNGDPARASSGKGYWGHNGAGYAALLAEVYPLIKAANPQAQVLIGGLAYDSFEDQGGPFVRDFLPSVLNAMKTSYGRYYMDALAFHYYPLSFSTISLKADVLRDILSGYGLSGLPMMVPEVAYWSASGAGSSEEMQARRLVQMYGRGLSAGVQHLSWCAVFDYGDPNTQPTGQRGLFRGQDLNSPKPAYYAYKTIATELSGYSFVRNFVASGIEGYVFYRPGKGEKTVLWATSSSRVVSFTGAQLRVVDKVGNEAIVIDGSGNDLDGRAGVIGIYATASPIYVMLYP